MTAADLPSRVQTRLDALGLTASGASKKAKLSRAFVTNILNGKSRSPRSENLDRLAGVLETSTKWLLHGAEEAQAVNGRSTISLDRRTELREAAALPILGEVAAGRWLEVEQHIDESKHGYAPIAPDPWWPVNVQYCLLVRGTSINEVAEDGDVLHVVDTLDTGFQPEPGDLVIVEQIRNGGHERARTVKAYHPGENKKVELRAVSDDADWQLPIHVPHPEHSFVVEKGLTIQIVAVVIGAYRRRPFSRLVRK